MTSEWNNDEVIQRLREYLKIPSVHPDIDYSDCVKFLQKQAYLLELPVRVYELVPKKPIVVITWEGLEPDLPSILLNSHMDVVPVYEEYWSYPPFEAQISEDGHIYARGVQDMKGVGMIHLEAVRKLKFAGIKLNKTVHISFVPDEEIGGIEGMKPFSESPDFDALNVGFALDESIPSPHKNAIIAFNGERTLRQVKVTCKGEPGHGSLLVADTAGEKLHYVIDKFMRFRQDEMQKLSGGAMLGEVTTVNLTKVEGGVQVNVLPERLCVYFDVRIAPQVDHEQFDNMLQTWCKEAGEGVYFEYIVKNPQVKNTEIDDRAPFWNVLNRTVKDMGLEVKCQVCPGATDARYVRARGVPAISLTPLVDTPPLLHAHDERLHVHQYKRGIDIMEKVLQAVGNIKY